MLASSSNSREALETSPAASRAEAKNKTFIVTGIRFVSFVGTDWVDYKTRLAVVAAAAFLRSFEVVMDGFTKNRVILWNDGCCRLHDLVVHIYI